MAHAAERLLSAAAHALRSDDERRRSVAALLLAAFPTEEAALPLLCRAISLEVSATADEGVLWRGGGLAVDLVGEFARQATLGKGLPGNTLMANLVRTLCKRPASVEVDPARLALELGLQLAPPAFYTSISPTPSRRAPHRHHHHHQPRSLGSASPRGLRSASSHHMAMARIHSVEISVRTPDASEEERNDDDDDVDELHLRARRLEEEESKLAAQAQQAYFRDIVAPNRRKLQELALEFLQAIDTAMRACSPALRALLRHMFGAVRERFPGSEFKAVGALICLRLFCPAIVAPETHNLTKPGEVTPKAKRNLVLVAKLLQTLVNETPFEKEVCMLPFNGFIHDHIPVVHSMFLAWMELRRRMTLALAGNCPQELAAFLSAHQVVCNPNVAADPRLPEEDHHPGQPDMELLSSSWPSTSSSSLLSSFPRPTVAHEKPRAASIDCLASLHKKCLGSFSGPCKQEVLQWTPVEVARWLERSAYSQETVEAVAQAGIDGRLLLRLSVPELLTLGVIKLGDRKKLAKAIDEISATCWQVGGVAMWLGLHGLLEYADAFIKHEVSGQVLLGLTQQKLFDIGVSKFGHVKRILRMIRELSLSPQDRLKAKPHAEYWTLGDVCDWLRTMELQQYLHLFYAAEVDGLKILQLTDPKLAKLGVDALGHRKRIMKHVRFLRASGDTPALQ
ncbi:SAM domain (Sterile alpha motif) domain containing protein [Acanthamoeba castellanii str. Neff]|uniref:SAM domain (Sterile alpha motif) domain containing protein n=1 Tax=Acanthamoeba castellanii (strain ATCC 30010 / Neff) TaxID=1257118 RepID=L8GPR2_ACACF|nr:SAM domain (Sterile alpha motif) domain containing protein [Acanthamoeba castellanii str. Neff]ELR14618.1 SAM domain (Sterile alpha motif) domain containing protein [Acanthamoeba castellanii str. Neff]